MCFEWFPQRCRLGVRIDGSGSGGGGGKHFGGQLRRFARCGPALGGDWWGLVGKGGDWWGKVGAYFLAFYCLFIGTKI